MEQGGRQEEAGSCVSRKRERDKMRGRQLHTTVGSGSTVDSTCGRGRRQATAGTDADAAASAAAADVSSN